MMEVFGNGRFRRLMSYHHLLDDHGVLIVAGTVDLREEEPKL